MVENDEDQTNFELYFGTDRTDAVGSDPQTGTAAQRKLRCRPRRSASGNHEPGRLPKEFRCIQIEKSEYMLA